MVASKFRRLQPIVKFLGIGDYNSLGDMYWRLSQAGHEVRVHVEQPEAREIFSGLLTQTMHWQHELDWIKDAGDQGIIVIETASMGAMADELRREGFQVVGGSAWSDRLEQDRAFGQSVMRQVGMHTAPIHSFDNYQAAIEFVRAHPARYVYKLSDGVSASTRNYVGELSNGSDLIALLRREEIAADNSVRTNFILMDHLSGVEVGIGAYFNGKEFLLPACIDWEHKRFFPGDLGELTGEMGTVVSYRHSQRLFEQTLALLAPALREVDHYGYLNINTIVNETGVWPLEFTCRFGYPGFAICDALHTEGWASILKKMISPNEKTIRTRDGFAVGVVLTVPPFPYEFGYAELSKGAPIFFSDDTTDEDRNSFHFGEVEMANGQLIASGSLGYIMVVTGVGDAIQDAQRAAYRRVRKVSVANMRYRNDIGDKIVREDFEKLRSLGHIF
jgi:phosphoribosylamine---glycine ligase